MGIPSKVSTSGRHSATPRRSATFITASTESPSTMRSRNGFFSPPPFFHQSRHDGKPSPLPSLSLYPSTGLAARKVDGMVPSSAFISVTIGLLSEKNMSCTNFESSKYRIRFSSCSLTIPPEVPARAVNHPWRNFSLTAALSFSSNHLRTLPFSWPLSKWPLRILRTRSCTGIMHSFLN